MALDCYPVGATHTPCPTTVDDWVAVICASLPPGFAFEAAETPGTLLNGRVRAVAHLLQVFNEHACALLPEFNCDTADLTLDDWNADYGIPDDCGVNDLCLKVTMTGDGTCASLDVIAKALGFDLCCEEIPIEIQAGCWNLGCEQMAPQPEFKGGGAELGFAGLSCGTPVGGAPEPDGDCAIAGYWEEEAVPTAAEQACTLDPACNPYQPPNMGELIAGCRMPWDVSGYVGTAYHLKVGVRTDSPALNDPGFAEVGGFELGCAQLCTPPVHELACFITRHRHAHVVPVFTYCDPP